MQRHREGAEVSNAEGLGQSWGCWKLRGGRGGTTGRVPKPLDATYPTLGAPEPSLPPLITLAPVFPGVDEKLRAGICGGGLQTAPFQG